MLRLPRARCVELLGKRISSLREVQQIHGQMIVSAVLQQGGAVGLLIDRYFDFSAKDGAKFAGLAFRYHVWELDFFAWNVMIRRSSPPEALLLYAELAGEGEGDDRTLIYALGACVRSRKLKEGMQIHARIVKSRSMERLDVAVLTTGVYFYGILGELDSAHQLFDEMPTRTPASWNALITGFCLVGAVVEAVALFKEMILGEDGARATERTMILMLSACSRIGELALGSSIHGYTLKTVSIEEDAFICTGLVDMYAKCGCLNSSEKAFNETREKKNVLTWTAMAAALAFHGRGEEATKLLESMISSGVTPNAVTFTCLLSACSHGGLVKEGLHLFDKMRGRYGVSPGIQHYGCVVDLLARVGMVEEAVQIVGAMPIRPDPVLWRVLLSACKIHEKFALGVEIGGKLMEMEGPEEQDGEDYVALSNLYASGDIWECVWWLREKMKLDGVQKQGGFSSLGNFPEHLRGR